MSKKTLNEIYQENPFNTYKKFGPHAIKEGYTKKEINEFLKNKVIHDQKVPPAKFIPIVSKTPGAYQMDTFINQPQKNGVNYLMLINVNTRKAFAYLMRGKGAQQVKAALNIFIKQEPNVKSIMSDQDAAYLSNEVLDWMKSNNIHYTTTTDDNHNNLGIINRFMRTIRDMAYKRGLIDNTLWDKLDKDGNYKEEFSRLPNPNAINPKIMQSLISSYNNTTHRTIGKSPNEFTEEDEREYIQKKKTDTVPYDFKPGEKVQIVVGKSPFDKKRSNVSNEAYTVDSYSGNMFKVRAKNLAVNDYPGYRLVRAKSNVPMAKNLKNDKRENVIKINSYNAKNDHYNITRENNTRDDIPASYMREGNQTKLSRMEREFWVNESKKKSIPPKIRKWF